MLHLFAKAPLPGQCKSRLAKDLNDPLEATRIHQELLFFHLKKLSKIPVERHAWIQNLQQCDTAVWPSIHQWNLHHVEQNLDLGTAVDLSIDMAPFNSYQIFVGTDTPALIRHLPSILEASQKKEAVLGPTLDGGVYIFAMPTVAGFKTSSISWGSTQVFQELYTFFSNSFSKVRVLSEETDIDHAADLHAMDFAK